MRNRKEIFQAWSAGWLVMLLLVLRMGSGVASVVEFHVDPVQRFDRIKPIWDVLNLWSPSFAVLPNGQPNTWHKDTHPFLRRVVLMTATGGRPDYPKVEILKRDENGNLYYDFNNFDKFLDAVLYNNLTPIVVFGATPFVLAPPNYHIGDFGSITNPPTDYDQWHEFVHTIVSHCLQRYGRSEVLRWGWRLYTEPDNWSWWTGSKQEYFKLYDYTVDAALKALPGITIGPGNMLGEIEDHWGLEILDHVFAGQNYYTGNTGTYIKFFTISAYERVEDSFPPLKKFEDRVTTIKQKLASYGALDTVAIGFDEGQLITDEDGKYLWLGDGTEYGASWQAAYQILGIREGFDRIVQWGFTSDGVKTPKYNVIEMLEKIKGQTRVGMQLALDERQGLAKTIMKIDGIASVPDDNSSLSIFIYSHFKYRRNDFFSMEYPQLVRIVVSRLPFQADSVRLTHWLVDSTHSNFFNRWLEDSKNLRRHAPNGIGGSIYDADVPVNLNADGRIFWANKKTTYLEMDDLEKASPDTLIPVAADGSVDITIGMNLHQVSLLTLRPGGATAVHQRKEMTFAGKINCSISPNPFNQQTVIQLHHIAGEVEIVIYNQLGQLVFKNSRAIGDSKKFHFIWNGRNLSGQALPSGVYFLKVKSARQTLVKKMILLR